MIDCVHEYSYYKQDHNDYYLRYRQCNNCKQNEMVQTFPYGQSGMLWAIVDWDVAKHNKINNHPINQHLRAMEPWPYFRIDRYWRIK